MPQLIRNQWRLQHTPPLPESPAKPRTRRGEPRSPLAERTLNKKEFVVQEIYALTTHPEKLHPDNRHVLDKIRQQLQVLRDMGFVEFLGRGRYRSV